MGIFSRFKDIVSSNFNAMLDSAEDPEKMIRLMIREMEETLVELKASCAASMAQRKKIVREMEGLESRIATWDGRARLAVEKGRDDLAREALVEKKVLARQVEAVERELAESDALVGQAQEDIALLEKKLAAAKEKQRMLVKRHVRANHRKRAYGDVRRAMDNDTYLRFERFEQQVERMEAEAEIQKPRQGDGLEDEFRTLETDADVEAELAALKDEAKKGS